ncbi:PQQ-binding-like beta-propeller repeat protein [Streptomyces sp. NPDC020681]|uniref:outer membrane protein assembly factor BamB family protein n=1 Tax=Streptomyces sp. NPDC020681 TaxID=3365083 RepID=UPI0037BA7ACD
MTQPPPPPPNQPPQGGGFGAPQDPPPGGFGAPTPPPQDPSYGYPQAPGTAPGTPPPAQPPQAPPGYGYPQQQQQPAQPGYGYPGQPPAQPGYGYPGQPPTQQYMPQPPQPGGSGKKLSTQMQIIIAASLAVVLIVGGGIWYSSSKGDDGGKKEEAKNSSGGTSKGSDGGGTGGNAADGPGKEKAPSDVNSKVAFQLPEPTRTDVTSVKGSWVTDKAYVKPGINSVVGYDASKGSPLWTLPLPGQVCAASRHVSEDNKAAIVFEAAKRVPPKNYQPCTEVGVVDLNSGKLLWSKSITGGTSGDGKAKFTEVTQSGTTVAAGGTDGGAAFDLNSGAVRWKPTTNAEGCYDMGYGGGPALVAVRKCGTYDNPQVLIQAVNPASGAPLFTYKMPAGVEYSSIVSSKPLVVAADVGDTGTFGISDFFSLDEKGTLKAKIPAVDKFQARCGSTEVESCQKVVVGNGKIYLPTEDHEGTGEYGDTNEIVSFDLATGKPTSDRADAGDKYSMFPVRMDGGNLIAYKSPPYDKGGQVVSIDGATFKPTVLMENPADKAVRDAEGSFTSDYAEFRYTNGRLYIGAVLLSKPSSTSSSFGKKYLAIAFSTGD